MSDPLSSSRQAAAVTGKHLVELQCLLRPLQGPPLSSALLRTVVSGIMESTVCDDGAEGGVWERAGAS